ncbi:MAG: hypothetical protein U0Q18_04720 [Bryobacteraceae bacterium]
MPPKLSLAVVCIAAGVCFAEEPVKPPAEASPQAVPAATAKPGEFIVTPGTRIPLGLINTITTKHSEEGDRVYLETVFPVLVNGRIVIPPGSYVAGSVTEVKRPGRMKGRGELFLRFDSLTLPNGVTRDFRARVGGVDGRGGEELIKDEGKIRGEGNKAGDARTVAEAAGAGASIGLIAGSATGHYAMGGGIGAAAGAAAGLMGVLLSRGPDAVLAKGSTIEMITDRPLYFEDGELNFGAMQPGHYSEGSGPMPSKKDSAWRRWPF